MSDVPAVAPTGTVAIESIEVLLAKIARVESTLDLLAEARTELEGITTRPVRQAWSEVPSLVTFATTYVNASSATIDVIDAAELRVAGMAEAIRLFASQMQIQDQSALDALAGLEKKIDEALAPAPIPTPDVQYNGQIIKTHKHQQPI